jgi:hypothetical protein
MKVVKGASVGSEEEDDVMMCYVEGLLVSVSVFLRDGPLRQVECGVALIVLRCGNMRIR